MTLRIILKKKYYNTLGIKTFILQNLYNRGASKGVLLLYIHKTFYVHRYASKTIAVRRNNITDMIFSLYFIHI